MAFRKRLTLFSASLFFYIIIQFISYFFFNTWRGETIFIPVIFSGILFGLKPTLIITLILVFPVNLLLCFLFQRGPGTVLSANAISGNIAIMIFGCVVGYVRDKSIQRQDELARLKLAEDTLKKYRDQLESMVEEKTAALSEKVLQLKAQERERIHLTKAIEQASEPIIIMDAEGTVQYVNPATGNLMGYNIREVVGINIFKSSQKQLPDLREKVFKTINTGKFWSNTLSHKKKDGGTCLLETTISPIFDESGALTNLLSIARDVTKEHVLERQVQQSQKMESIGTLAGGIAHDFNNILAAIVGYAELCLDDSQDNPENCQSLQQILNATSRAKSLVSQILAFSRSADIEKKPIKISPLVKETCKFLRSSLPTTIEIKQHITAENDFIMADPTQFHQILMNLCTNAGHAMEKTGGVLEVRLENILLNKNNLLSCPELKPGLHLQLIVKDTGHGISTAIKDHIFEPYFTTKSKGEGTGLGLAVTHGYVKDFGGNIKVESKKGKGTAFTLLFPVITEILTPDQSKDIEPLPIGTETIMLVDDEFILVKTCKRILERLGYTVIGETSPEEALDRFKQSKESYDLIITDKTMPKMTGFSLAREINKIRTDIPILLYTGHKEKDDEKKIKAAGISDIIMKPFDKKSIAKIVRKVLDQKQAKE